MSYRLGTAIVAGLALAGFGGVSSFTSLSLVPVVKAAPATLSIRGNGVTPLSLTSEEFSKLPRATASVTNRDGSKTVFEGVSLFEVMRRAGMKPGEGVHGKEAMTITTAVVVVEAADGYKAAFAQAEFDPAYTNRVILVADRKDGKPLGDEEGPFRLIAPDDKRPARWVRNVATLTFKSLKD
jgi:DMSO/TMAO reductase YedYZ molybdopterin-dependent catalytic subunit